LKVFDQGQLSGFTIICLNHNRRKHGALEKLDGSESTLTSDQLPLEATRVPRGTDNNRLHQARALNGVRQLLQRTLIEFRSRLIPIRLNLVDLNQLNPRRTPFFGDLSGRYSTAHRTLRNVSL
jgi:hypothetical protein